MNLVVHYGARSRIVTFDCRDREQTVATMTTPSWGDDDSALAWSFLDELLRPNSPLPIQLKARYVADEQAYDVALDAGHLLASLALGTVAGLGLALLARLKLRRVDVETD